MATPTPLSASCAPDQTVERDSRQPAGSRHVAKQRQARPQAVCTRCDLVTAQLSPRGFCGLCERELRTGRIETRGDLPGKAVMASECFRGDHPSPWESLNSGTIKAPGRCRGYARLLG